MDWNEERNMNRMKCHHPKKYFMCLDSFKACVVCHCQKVESLISLRNNLEPMTASDKAVVQRMLKKLQSILAWAHVSHYSIDVISKPIIDMYSEISTAYWEFKDLLSDVILKIYKSASRVMINYLLRKLVEKVKFVGLKTKMAGKFEAGNLAALSFTLDLPICKAMFLSSYGISFNLTWKQAAMAVPKLIAMISERNLQRIRTTETSFFKNKRIEVAFNVLSTVLKSDSKNYQFDVSQAFKGIDENEAKLVVALTNILLENEDSGVSRSVLGFLTNFSCHHTLFTNCFTRKLASNLFLATKKLLMSPDPEIPILAIKLLHTLLINSESYHMEDKRLEIVSLMVNADIGAQLAEVLAKGDVELMDAIMGLAMESEKFPIFSRALMISLVDLCFKTITLSKKSHQVQFPLLAEFVAKVLSSLHFVPEQLQTQIVNFYSSLPSFADVGDRLEIAKLFRFCDDPANYPLIKGLFETACESPSTTDTLRCSEEAPPADPRAIKIAMYFASSLIKCEKEYLSMEETQDAVMIPRCKLMSQLMQPHLFFSLLALLKTFEDEDHVLIQTFLVCIQEYPTDLLKSKIKFFCGSTITADTVDQFHENFTTINQEFSQLNKNVGKSERKQVVWSSRLLFSVICWMRSSEGMMNEECTKALWSKIFIRIVSATLQNEFSAFFVSQMEESHQWIELENCLSKLPTKISEWCYLFQDDETSSKTFLKRKAILLILYYECLYTGTNSARIMPSSLLCSIKSHYMKTISEQDNLSSEDDLKLYGKILLTILSYRGSHIEEDDAFVLSKILKRAKHNISNLLSLISYRAAVMERILTLEDFSMEELGAILNQWFTMNREEYTLYFSPTQDTIDTQELLKRNIVLLIAIAYGQKDCCEYSYSLRMKSCYLSTEKICPKVLEKIILEHMNSILLGDFDALRDKRRKRRHPEHKERLGNMTESQEMGVNIVNFCNLLKVAVEESAFEAGILEPTYMFLDRFVKIIIKFRKDHQELELISLKLLSQLMHANGLKLRAQEILFHHKEFVRYLVSCVELDERESTIVPPAVCSCAFDIMSCLVAVGAEMRMQFGFHDEDLPCWRMVSTLVHLQCDTKRIALLKFIMLLLRQKLRTPILKIAESSWNDKDMKTFIHNLIFHAMNIVLKVPQDEQKNTIWELLACVLETISEDGKWKRIQSSIVFSDWFLFTVQAELILIEQFETISLEALKFLMVWTDLQLKKVVEDEEEWWVQSCIRYVSFSRQRVLQSLKTAALKILNTAIDSVSTESSETQDKYAASSAPETLCNTKRLLYLKEIAGNCFQLERKFSSS